MAQSTPAATSSGATREAEFQMLQNTRCGGGAGGEQSRQVLRRDRIDAVVGARAVAVEASRRPFD